MSAAGHGFVRPGQVAPHLPAPDNCMVCGLPEAAHTGAELAARVTAAHAVLADFQLAVAERGSYPFDWQSWALRLGQHLQFVLQELRQPGPPSAAVAQRPSYVSPDGSAWLAPADLYAVRSALTEAGDFTDNAMRRRYRTLAEQLRSSR